MNRTLITTLIIIAIMFIIFFLLRIPRILYVNDPHDRTGEQKDHLDFNLYRKY